MKRPSKEYVLMDDGTHHKLLQKNCISLDEQWLDSVEEVDDDEEINDVVCDRWKILLVQCLLPLLTSIFFTTASMFNNSWFTDVQHNAIILDSIGLLQRCVTTLPGETTCYYREGLFRFRSSVRGSLLEYDVDILLLLLILHISFNTAGLLVWVCKWRTQRRGCASKCLTWLLFLFTSCAFLIHVIVVLYVNNIVTEKCRRRRECVPHVPDVMYLAAGFSTFAVLLTIPLFFPKQCIGR